MASSGIRRLTWLGLNSEQFGELVERFEFPETRDRNILWMGPNDYVDACFRFLCNGESFQDISKILSTNIKTTKKVIMRGCMSMNNALEFMMPPPTPNSWKLIETEFYQTCKFPQCYGALDGIRLKVKENYSILNNCVDIYEEPHAILYVLVDANFRITTIETVLKSYLNEPFNRTNMSMFLEGKLSGIPETGEFSPLSTLVPSVILANKELPMTERIMTPFRESDLFLQPGRSGFNKQHQEVMKRSATTLTLLEENFKVFNMREGINFKYLPTVLRTCCLLHNYLLRYSLEYGTPMPDYLNMISRLNFDAGRQLIQGHVNRELFSGCFHKTMLDEDVSAKMKCSNDKCSRCKKN